MLHLIPASLHRAALRIAHRLRQVWRRTVKLPRAGVSLVALDTQGRVLLVRHSYGSGRWGLPGGALGWREDPSAGARRELREELGCEAEQLTLVATIEERLWGAPHTAFVFGLRLIGQPRPDGREVIEAGFFPPHALPGSIGPISRRRIEAWREHARP